MTKIIHILNVADLFFMAMGLAVAVIMAVVGGDGDQERRSANRRQDATGVNRAARARSPKP